MEELDDLLGGPSAPPQTDDDLFGDGPGGVEELDDLLGDAGYTRESSVDLLGGSDPLDDDLLFGPGPTHTEDPAPAHSEPQQQQAQQQQQPQQASPSAGDTKTAPPAAGNQKAAKPPPQRLHDIEMEPLKSTTPALKPFIFPNTYFLKFGNVYTRDGHKSRRAINVTDSQVLIMNEEVKSDRTMNVAHIVAVYTQTIVASKMMGLSKDLELRVILQCRGERDLFFAVTKQEGQDPSHDIVHVLQTVAAAYGVQLRVTNLGEEDKIKKYVNWNAVTDKPSVELSEHMAKRQQMKEALAAINKQVWHLETTLATYANSTQGQTIESLSNEIAQMETIIASFEGKIADMERAKEHIAADTDQVQCALRAEQSKRIAAVRTSMESSQQQQLVRQAAEHELLKAAHQRDMDKFAVLTALYQRRLNDARQSKYTGSEISFRVDDLEELLDEVERRAQTKSEAHANAIKGTAESKKRLQHLRQLHGTLSQDINTIKATPLDEDLPSSIANLTSVADLAPEGMEGIQKKPSPSQPSQLPQAQAATPAPEASLPKAPIVLDDDEL